MILTNMENRQFLFENTQNLVTLGDLAKFLLRDSFEINLNSSKTKKEENQRQSGNTDCLFPKMISN